MTEQELIEYLRKSIYKIEDQLLLSGKIRLDDKANIVVISDNFQDEEVIIYQLLSNIKAGFKFRKMQVYKDVKNQYTEEYIKKIFDRFEVILK